jgi:hypothetical protein
VWTPSGESIDSQAGVLGLKRAFTFDEPGTYTVKVRMYATPQSSHRDTNQRVMLERNVEALVDIVVGGEDTGGEEEPEICPQCGKPLGTNPNCAHCIFNWRGDPEDIQPVNQ